MLPSASVWFWYTEDMTWFLYVVFAAGAMIALLSAVCYWLWQLLRSHEQECQRLGAELDELEAEEHAFTDRNERVHAIKQARKERIQAELEADGQLGSAEVAERLGVSQRTARNYLSELVEEGIVLQSDETGRGVRYMVR